MREEKIMDFVHKELSITLSDGDDSNLVWEQKLGDLVIIVLDDYWDYVLGNPEAPSPHTAVLTQLRLRACESPKTRAIGFFVLPGNRKDADKVLLSIQNWIKDITIPKHDIRVCFLVDALYGAPGHETVDPSTYIIGKLADLPLTHSIAYLTQAGEGAAGLLPGYPIFSKADQANYARQHNMFSPELMSFLGLHKHEDEIINDAVEIAEKQLPTADTHSHKSLDELIHYLNDFIFDGYQEADLAGKLPQIESAYFKFMARYLKAALLKLEQEDEIPNEQAMKQAMERITGNDELQSVQARRQVQRILGRSSTSHLISEDQMVIDKLQKFVESDDLLRQASVEIFGEDPD